MDVADLIDEFLLWLDRGRGCSPKTIATYRLALGQLTAWMRGQGSSLRWDEFRVDRVRDFLAYLRDERGNDARSIALKLAAVKSWLSFLKRSLPLELRTTVPVVDWTYRTPQRPADALERAQFDRLLAIALQRHQEAQAARTHGEELTPRLCRQILAAQRDYVILLLLAGTGLRVGELVGLNVSDVDIADCSLEVLGKGGYRRRIWWSVSPLKEEFAAYLTLAAIPASDSGESPLFRNARDGGRLTSRSVERMLHFLAEAAAVTATPHTLRHTFATLAIESGANIKAVSEMLGHRHVATTLQIYTHLSPRYVREVFTACHPFAAARPSLDQTIAWRQRSLIALPDQTGWRQRQAASST